VKSPVWFVENGGKLYIWTIATSGKVKRIRRNPKARISASSARGQPKGNWIEARARILNSTEGEDARTMIKKKYGFQFWLLNRLHGKDRIIIELDPSS
jgi:PPOX class probable F420-dependent enzyme